MKTAKVTLVEYGAGNLSSVEQALRRLGAKTNRAGAAGELMESEAIVLPGVGHFGALMRSLEERALATPLREALRRGTPFLGICLGLQALYESSAEDAGQLGLGICAGRVEALPKTAKLPHMGWNQVRRVRESVLLRGVPEDAWFYFAHSYAALWASAAGAAAVAMCDHGAPFVAAMEDKNVLATQFHPEKSGEEGLQVLRNFVELASAGAA